MKSAQAMLEESQEIRRANVRGIAAKVGTAKLARLLGYSSGSFLSQMIGPNPTRPVSWKTARMIESRLSIEPGLLEVDLVSVDEVQP